MVEILLFFLGASLILYIVLGGADYGAGILELLPAGRLRDEQRSVINKAMGPVWEANHMWLILMVVILFMGFPPVFLTLMVHLHIPMVALLVGIVLRGSAFTFRHYDAIQSEPSQTWYSRIFGFSSLWTAIWIGVIAGGLERGLIDPQQRTFWGLYIAPWFGVFPLAVAAFTVAIFVFLAAVFLIGESSNQDLKRRFATLGLIANVAVVVMGGVVFLVADQQGLPLLATFIASPGSLTAMVLATALFFLVWRYAHSSRAIVVRLCAAAQIGLILVGWIIASSGEIIRTAQGPINFYASAAPEATLWQLTLALCVGSLLIFPSLIFLFRTFKGHLG